MNNLSTALGLMLLAFGLTVIAPLLFLDNGLIISLLLLAVIWLPVSIPWFLSFRKFLRSKERSYSGFWEKEREQERLRS